VNEDLALAESRTSNTKWSLIIVIIIILHNDINIAEYLNTKYKGDQFLNIVKNHESIQQNMNSIVKVAAKITEDLNKRNENNDAKQDEIQHTKAKLGVVLKKNWKSKAMHGQYIRNTNR
jgi:hypothetical protein